MNNKKNEFEGSFVVKILQKSTNSKNTSKV